jgi:hypothetical protein
MIRRSAADEIRLPNHEEPISAVTILSARETPADDWIYLFELATPAALDVDPERLASNPQQALPIESEDSSALAWVDHIDLWIGQLIRRWSRRTKPRGEAAR